MDLVVKSVILYLVIFTVLRITGKRALNQITSFDLVLLLLIAEATDNSIIGDDHSITSTLLVIITLVTLEIVFSLLKQKFPRLDMWMEGTPVVIVDHGKLLKDRAQKEIVDESDVLAEARKVHGLDRMEQIEYAILERNGGISIIPKR